MKKRKHILIISFLLFTTIAVYYFFILPVSQSNESLSPPTFYHWFGTDINGADVLSKSIEAFGFELLTLSTVLAIIWLGGLIFGSVTFILNRKGLQEFFLNFIHYVATLPILLIALFLLIIFGAGLINSIVVLSISIIPTQALFTYNQLKTANNEDFLVAKKSYGLSNKSILRFHLLPFILKRYNNYTFSRVPEIIMMNIALNFLGLGIKYPHYSLGRMLFDGLSFMFSAWWLWVIPTLLTLLIYIIIFLFNYDEFTRRDKYFI